MTSASRLAAAGGDSTPARIFLARRPGGSLARSGFWSKASAPAGDYPWLMLRGSLARFRRD